MVRRGASATPYRRRGLKFFPLLFGAFLALCIVSTANAQLTPIAQGNSRLLLQADGSTELIERFRLDLPAGLNPNDIEFVQSSSNGDTLQVNTDRNIIPTRTGNGVNVTCTLDFDKLPGVSTYTLAVKRRGPNQPTLFESSITYTVVGFALYKKNPDGSKTILSGTSNPGYTIPFENAAQPLVQPEDRIYAYIQFPDGTTSENLPQSTQRLPLGPTLTATLQTIARQVNHDPEKCSFDTIGTYSSTDGIILPPNCGFGFYRDAPGNLLFGFKWIPFRTGPLRLRFSWPGLTAVNTDLADETFETNFNAAVTGVSPIVVTKIDPKDTPFRTEGGQPVVVEFFNGNERPISDMRIEIEPGTFAKLVPGSISPIQLPSRIQNATFLTEPGTGGPFNAKVQFKSPTTPGTPGTPPGTPGAPGTPQPGTPGAPGTPPPGTTGAPGTPPPGTTEELQVHRELQALSNLGKTPSWRMSSNQFMIPSRYSLNLFPHQAEVLKEQTQ